MNRFFVSLFLIACLLANCSRSANSTDKKEHVNKREEIKLRIDLEKGKKIQTEVDNGHQPWRLEPIDVAYEAVKVNINRNVKYEKCSLISETENEASVQCKIEKKLYCISEEIGKTKWYMDCNISNGSETSLIWWT